MSRAGSYSFKCWWYVLAQSRDNPPVPHEVSASSFLTFFESLACKAPSLRCALGSTRSFTRVEESFEWVSDLTMTPEKSLSEPRPSV